MNLTEQTLAIQAFQARVALSGEQIAMLLPKLNAKLDSFAVLGEVNTQGIAPLVHVYPFQHTVRKDEVQQDFIREQLLANAPLKTDEAFVVPKTVE